MTTLKRAFVGIATDPALVGALRALLLYGLPIGATALIGYLGTIRDPRWLWLAALVPVIRAAEGAIDRALKGAGANNTAPPTGAHEAPTPAMPPPAVT